MLNPQQEALEILRQENAALADERDNLLEHKRLHGEDASAEKDENIRVLTDKITQLESELTQAKTESGEYEQVLKDVRAEAITHYVRMKSTGLTQVDRSQTEAMLQNCRSYMTLKSHIDAWESAADAVYRSKPSPTTPVPRTKQEEDRLYNQIDPNSY